jgi:hypothetical protein
MNHSFKQKKKELKLMARRILFIFKLKNGF